MRVKCPGTKLFSTKSAIIADEIKTREKKSKWIASLNLFKVDAYLEQTTPMSCL